MVILDPRFDRVVILPDSPEEMYGGVIVKPNAEPPQRGMIVAAGPEVTAYALGDRVMYGRYAGTPVTVDEQEYLVMHEKDILLRLKES